MPDISMLPLLSKYFSVTTDELLGLKPIESQYIYRTKDLSSFWNQSNEYITASRYDMWNDDYLQFLINHVWKITGPVRIADFGCGYGYLGMKILPLLPPGSSYLGLEIKESRIKKAEEIFKELNYDVSFIKCDYNDYLIDSEFDIVICQTVLRHSPNPKEILAKMIETCKSGGLVVSIDVNRVIENAGLYIHNYDYKPLQKSQLLQKNWAVEFDKEGRDYAIGHKMPCYMKELGLKQIACRMNDRVSFIDPDNSPESYHQALASLVTSNQWDKPFTKSRKDKITKFFMTRGMTKNEIDEFIDLHEKEAEYVNSNTVSIVKSKGFLISYGWKK